MVTDARILVVSRTLLDDDDRVFFGRQGGFHPEVSFMAGDASTFAFGDFNDDGLADIAFAQQGVSLLLSRSSAMEGDLGVYLGLVPNAAALRVDNHGAMTSQSYTLRLRINVRFGPLSLGEMPNGVWLQLGETARILCNHRRPWRLAASHIALPFTRPWGHHNTLMAPS